MRVKVFTGMMEVEEEINKWLRLHEHIRIQLVTQSESAVGRDDWTLTVSIFYTSSSENKIEEN